MRQAAPLRSFVSVGFAAVLLLAGSHSPGGDAHAREEGAGKKTHRSQPARTDRAAPDRTGSLAKVAPIKSSPGGAATMAAPPVASDADEGPLVPVLLPNVPRARMIACGETWRSMKVSGTTGDESWRDFALKCLVAREVSQP